MINAMSADDTAALSFALGAADLPPLAAETGSPRLLLVDDEPRLLSSLCELLKDGAYQLATADCGATAVEQLSKLQFDLVLLDLRLPDLSGHEIMDFIKARGIDAKVIVLSGDSGIDAAIGALKRGAYDYLRKPYSREELLNTVDNATTSRQQLDDTLAGSVGKLQDVDYATAVSSMNQQLLGLQAAQQAYTRIAQLSLFSYL